jgi:23S rRNA (pseudouridine1915-N3)-methyltransferase
VKSLRIMWVGDRKARVWEQTAGHYRSLLSHYVDLKESAIKPAASGPSAPERIAGEGKRILAGLTPKDVTICLDRGGKMHSSESFSAFLGSLLEDANRTPCFVIGGAFGLAPEVLAQSSHRLALGPMTFPHEMARVVLLEQLYRAMTIYKGFPYHH